MSGVTTRTRAPAVRLRPVEPRDLPAFYEHQCDPEACRLAVANPRSPEDFRAHWQRILANENVRVYAIIADGELAGNINGYHADGSDLVGYWIDRAHWGRGIATRALELFLIAETRRPLHARVALTNARSRRVLERCGFRDIGHSMSQATERFPACEEAMFRLDA